MVSLVCPSSRRADNGSSETGTPNMTLDFAASGSKEGTSLDSRPLPPGAFKGAPPDGKAAPRGLWYIADLGPAGLFRDGAAPAAATN